LYSCSGQRIVGHEQRCAGSRTESWRAIFVVLAANVVIAIE
jgi:hypothetical protein